jgi:hypothetical protein
MDNGTDILYITERNYGFRHFIFVAATLPVKKWFFHVYFRVIRIPKSIRGCIHRDQICKCIIYKSMKTRSGRVISMPTFYTTTGLRTSRTKPNRRRATSKASKKSLRAKKGPKKRSYATVASMVSKQFHIPYRTQAMKHPVTKHRYLHQSAPSGPFINYVRNPTSRKRAWDWNDGDSSMSRSMSRSASQSASQSASRSASRYATHTAKRPRTYASDEVGPMYSELYLYPPTHTSKRPRSYASDEADSYTNHSFSNTNNDYHFGKRYKLEPPVRKRVVNYLKPKLMRPRSSPKKVSYSASSNGSNLYLSSSNPSTDDMFGPFANK